MKVAANIYFVPLFIFIVVFINQVAAVAEITSEISHNDIKTMSNSIEGGSFAVLDQSSKKCINQKHLSSKSYITSRDPLVPLSSKMRVLDIPSVAEIMHDQNKEDQFFTLLINQSSNSIEEKTTLQKKNTVQWRELSDKEVIYHNIKYAVHRLKTLLFRLFIKIVQSIVPNFVLKRLVSHRMWIYQILHLKRPMYPYFCSSMSDWYNVTRADGSKNSWFIEMRAYVTNQTECTTTLAKEKFDIEFSKVPSRSNIPYADSFCFHVTKYKNWYLNVLMVRSEMLQDSASGGVRKVSCPNMQYWEA